MSVESDLKKEGISILKPLDTFTINRIAKNISQKIVSSFPEQNLDANDIFISISRLNMYTAKMPKDNSVAKYYYKNSSIYFDENVDLDNIEKYAIHECIHVIQSKKDVKNNVVQLGLCDFTHSNMPGMALNEAAVQLMTEKCLQSPTDTVKYFGIELSTNSPDYYALECNLLNQMAYITGEKVLINSTLFGNTAFKETFSNFTNSTAYKKIEKNIDKIMNLEYKLAVLDEKLADIKNTDKSIFKISNQIKSTKNNITNLFLQTQNLIMTSYFNSYFDIINTPRELENFRNKLYNFKNYIGVTENYTFYNDYYLKMMTLLESKYEKLNNTESSLVVVKEQTGITKLFNKLTNLFGIKQKNQIHDIQR